MFSTKTPSKSICRCRQPALIQPFNLNKMMFLKETNTCEHILIFQEKGESLNVKLIHLFIHDFRPFTKTHSLSLNCFFFLRFFTFFYNSMKMKENSKFCFVRITLSKNCVKSNLIYIKFNKASSFIFIYFNQQHFLLFI
jgi:hypothetical protein